MSGKGNGNGDGAPAAPASFAEAIGLELPRCETCFYFQPGTAADEKGDVRIPPGCGWCLAEPPNTSGMPDQLGRSITLIPQLRPTLPASRCRHWQSDARNSLDHLTEAVGRLVEAMRDTGPAAGKGNA